MDLQLLFINLQEELARGYLTFEVALEWVVQEAAAVTRANGAALALPADDGAMTCRASMGSAPAVGSVIRPGAGLSGECVRTREPVYAADIESDLRVDRAAAQALGSYSVLIVPVLQGELLWGILEVFSVQKDGFGPRAQAQLRHMAALLAPVLVSGATAQAEQDITTPENESAAPQDPLDGLREQLTGRPTVEKSRHLPLVIALVAALVLIAILLLSLYSKQSGLQWQPVRFANVVGLADGGNVETQVGTPSLAAEDAPFDCQRARHWMELAAGQGNVAAQYGLARAQQPCSAPDSSESAGWLEVAARNGHVIAQREYAALLADGTAVERDLVQAYAWYVVAHQAGDPVSGEALKRLTPLLADDDITRVRAQVGYMYANGIGTTKDYVTAYVWLLLGTNGQGPLAQQIASHLTPEQIATARQRAADWLRRRSPAPSSADLTQSGPTIRPAEENARLRDIPDRP